MLAIQRLDIHAGNLGKDLLALVKIRVSQLDGCAYCLDRHGREAPGPYSAREQAALALTEEVTLIGQGCVPDRTWKDAADGCKERHLVTLIMAMCAINIWNRMVVGTRQSLPDLDSTAGKA